MDYSGGSNAFLSPRGGSAHIFGEFKSYRWSPGPQLLVEFFGCTASGLDGAGHSDDFGGGATRALLA
jgi:hypothetical protein